MDDKELLKKLEDAAVCCRECGMKYGIYSVGCSSVYMGTCRVCDQEKPVTETRDWGYLYKGRTALIKSIKLNTIADEPNTNKNI